MFHPQYLNTPTELASRQPAVRQSQWQQLLPRRLLGILLLALLPAIAFNAQQANANDSATVREAKSVDLDEPVSPRALVESEVEPSSPHTNDFDLLRKKHETIDSQVIYSNNLPDLNIADSLLLLGSKVPPGTATRLAWTPSQSFEGIAVPTPVLVVNGAKNGPTLCLTAAIHGDELNGIEIVRRVLYALEPEKLSGAVIGVPIVNLQGFRRTSRYLTDRRDLNRFFPGNSTGSSASRIAHSFFHEVISHCDALVDLHTGSFHRTNLPQLRADLRDSKIVELTHGFGETVVLHSEGAQGTLRRAAAEKGIPSVTLEAGAPMQLQKDSVAQGVAGIQTLLSRMNMVKKFNLWGNPEPIYYRSTWVRSDQGGILMSEVELGQQVASGELLGTVTDPITNVRTNINSPYTGRVLGMALNQVVLPGFAAYRIGMQTSDKPAADHDEDEVNADGDLAKSDDPEAKIDIAKLKTDSNNNQGDKNGVTEDSE